MKKKGIGKGKMIILIVLGFIVLLLTVNFIGTEKQARDRLRTYTEKSTTIQTSYGEMTFVDEGTGEPIISCHGICGGYDQAYDTLTDRVDTYRILAPSRFGYTGTAMPDNPTIDKQADAFVEMLDHQGIDKTYVLATSAGGTSAIKFALKYPERTKGLILFCSGYPAMDSKETIASYVGPPAVLCNDFCMWLISPLFQPLMGMDQSTLKMIMPFGEKKEGIVFDAEVTNTEAITRQQEYDMSELKVPVLILHAKDDKLADFAHVAYWAERIPDCTFVPFETGGHLMVGNSDKINASVDSFIQKTK